MNDTEKKTDAAARMQRLRRWIAPLVTMLAVLLALWAVWQLWDHYERAPWTRDGRVRANVIQLAPDVSGLVSRLHVQDNQAVRAGDLLFEVDPARYQLAERQAAAVLQAQRALLIQAEREQARNQVLDALVSRELQEQSRARVAQARAVVAEAEVALDTARLNQQRAQVRAPSDGVVTNLELRQGAYATAGRPVLALLDQAGLYVEGYFEETKLARIHIGDRVRVMPMGSSRSLNGTVQSVAAGIADHDRSTSANLLPSVNPTFNWVRLAQRVPVRVELEAHAGLSLVAGQTVTVQVLELADGAPHGARP
jgi:multidrug resistance efflux pump